MRRLVVDHTTTYRYAEPVAFGPHRMMLRPRDSHEVRLISATLTTSLPADLVWTYDIFGNVVCTARFDGMADELTISSRLELERYASTAPTRFQTGADVPFPVVYTNDEIRDLGACLSGSGEVFSPELHAWIGGFQLRHPGGTMERLRALCMEIHQTFSYEMRFEGDARSASHTFALKSGACRDYAAFFIAVARNLGLGARFVSGYLFDPPGDGATMQGVGSTHAWAEVYLPDAGWIEFDPTNGLIASDRLIRVAVAREADQASPVKGSFIGTPGAFSGLWVGVDVTGLPSAPSAVAA